MGEDGEMIRLGDASGSVQFVADIHDAAMSERLKKAEAERDRYAARVRLLEARLEAIRLALTQR